MNNSVFKSCAKLTTLLFASRIGGQSPRLPQTLMLRVFATVLLSLLAKSVLFAAPPERGFLSAKPAQHWEDALVTGNGAQGAMVFGDPENETIILNHGRLYLPLHAPLPPPDTASILPELRQLLADGKYQAAANRVVTLANAEGYQGKHWTDPFIPACDLKLAMPARGAVADYERTVDFSTAVATVNWSDPRGRFERRVFASRADDAVVVSITGPRGAVDCRLSLGTRPVQGTGGWSPEAMFARGMKECGGTAGESDLFYRGVFKNSWKGGLQGYEVVAKVLPKGGTLRKEGDALVVAGADEILVLLRTVPLTDLAKAGDGTTLAALAKLTPDYRRLLDRHVALHRPIFERVRLDLGGGDERGQPTETLIARSRTGPLSPALLEKLFDASRYNILCSSGEVAPNLQGIWTGTWSPFWSGDFTMNGNLQSAMAANLATGMAECLEPYFRFLETHMPAFRDNAKRLYGCRGIHVPSRASTHGWNNHFDATWPMTFWTAGAPWAAQFYYDYYLFTGDRAFLKTRAYPFMKEASVFYEDLLFEGPDGKLVFSPSHSPENHPGNSSSQACINATMDIAATRELLTNTIAAAETLDTDADSVARWRALLAKLPPYQLNDEGGVKEWTTPLLTDNDAHRHCSHLYALYNGLPDDIATDPALRRAFGVSLEKRLDVRRREFAGGKGPEGRPPGEMAFGIVLEGLAAASLRNARDCGETIGWLARHYWGSNLVSRHNPGAVFNTDLSGGFPAIIARTLVDSGAGWVEILPALPPELPAGKIEGLRCRGRIIVQSLAWDSKQAAVTLLSPITQTIELRGNGGTTRQTLELPAGRPVSVTLPRTAPPPPPRRSGASGPGVCPGHKEARRRGAYTNG